MEIKEVENLLSVSRSNIRFYEKQGLLDPKRGKNNYRNYSEADVAMLRKIIVLRKLGFSVDEISAMQKGELLLPDAVKENIVRLESEIERLKGALETSKTLSVEQPSFDEMDEERYWNAVTQAESKGKKFVDICRDYLSFQVGFLDRVSKYYFLVDFKKFRKKHGILKASGALLLASLIIGAIRALIWHEPLWGGFLYPTEIFLAVMLLTFPIYVLGKKAPKAASVIVTILLMLMISFLVLIAGLIIFSLIYGLVTGSLFSDIA